MTALYSKIYIFGKVSVAILIICGTKFYVQPFQKIKISPIVNLDHCNQKCTSEEVLKSWKISFLFLCHENKPA